MTVMVCPYCGKFEVIGWQTLCPMCGAEMTEEHDDANAETH